MKEEKSRRSYQRAPGGEPETPKQQTTSKEGAESHCTATGLRAAEPPAPPPVQQETTGETTAKGKE